MSFTCATCKHWEKMSRKKFAMFEGQGSKHVGICKKQVTPMSCTLTMEEGYCDEWEEEQ